MALTFPTPPTPPTPPSVDKGDGNTSHAKIDAPNFFQVPFVNDGGVNFKNPATETFQGDKETFSEDEEVEEETPQENSAVGTRQVTTPETLARDAVANGAGTLTKKTVTKPQQENSAPATSTNQNTVQLPQSSTSSALSDTERGKAVLREFQEEDRQLSSAENNLQTSTETPKTFHLNQMQGQQGGLYWIVILVFAAVAGFIFVQKFLVTDKPKLKKSDLFDDADDRLKKVAEKVAKPVKKSPTPALKNYSVPPAKTVTKPVQAKKDDDKGKHFEVRV